MPDLRVAVVGGTGHAGGELCRLLLCHPNVTEIIPTSRGDEVFERVHRNLLGCGLEFSSVDDVWDRRTELDVAFLSTPSGEAMRLAPDLLDAGVRVVDVSADFRFSDPAVYAEVYGRRHEAPHLLAEAVCGITELHRGKVATARLVANPGCYVIAAVLALAPILEAGVVDLTPTLHLHAVNGTSGAGTAPKREILHAQAYGSMLPYSMDGHRHGPEIEARLSEIVNTDVAVSISTAHGNFARGVYLQAALTAADWPAPTRDELIDVYVRRYGRGRDGEPFVIVSDGPKRRGLNEKEYDIYPDLRAVVGSNFCHLGIDVDQRRGVVKAISVIDNLVKGAAGSAIQNMNVMFGLDETSGLGQYGL